MQCIISSLGGNSLTLPIANDVVKLLHCRNLSHICNFVSKSGLTGIRSIAGLSSLSDLLINVFIQIILGCVFFLSITKQICSLLNKSLLQLCNSSVVLTLDDSDSSIYTAISLLILISSLSSSGLSIQCFNFFLDSRFRCVELKVQIVFIAGSYISLDVGNLQVNLCK